MINKNAGDLSLQHPALFFKRRQIYSISTNHFVQKIFRR